MICTKCGARMMDTDRFCPKCGAKAIKEKRCPECGTLLREGTKFCHKCGSPVANTESVGKASQETLDIPIDAIEQNILSETAAEIRADRRTSSPKSMPSRVPSEKSVSSKSAASHSSSGKSTSSKSTVHSDSGKSAPSKKKSSVPAPPPKKRADYREEEDWDDDDDWDDEDDDEGVDAITVMTAIVGCVLLVVVAVLGYQLYRQYVPKNYDRLAEESQDEETGVQGQEMEELPESGGSEGDTFTLTVIQNVNVRDNPSTSGTNIIKVAKEGETYTSTGSVDGGQWYAILLDDGSTGYVFHEYVTVE